MGSPQSCPRCPLPKLVHRGPWALLPISSGLCGLRAEERPECGKGQRSSGAVAAVRWNLQQEGVLTGAEGSPCRGGAAEPQGRGWATA